MTPREWARLQGFPDNYLIPVADASAYKQFGNSVAIPAIQATAEQIVNRIVKYVNRNKGEWSEIYTLLKIIADKIYLQGIVFK